MFVILITGATGFLGGHLLRKIIDKTNYEIVVLKRSFSNTDRIYDILNNERISCYDIDYRNNEIMSTFADIKKINEFGYNLKTTVEEGLKKILAIYAKERFNG